MTPTTFTPAQQAFYDALIVADTDLLHIAQRILKAAVDADFGINGCVPDPEDYDAPLGTPAWDVIENAATEYDKATSGMSEKESTLAALDVISAALAAKAA